MYMQVIKPAITLRGTLICWELRSQLIWMCVIHQLQPQNKSKNYINSCYSRCRIRTPITRKPLESCRRLEGQIAVLSSPLPLLLTSSGNNGLFLFSSLIKRVKQKEDDDDDEMMMMTTTMWWKGCILIAIKWVQGRWKEFYL